MTGIPEIAPGADLAATIHAAIGRSGLELLPGDVLAVAQKIVSKAEGRMVDLTTVRVGGRARRLALRLSPEADPRVVQVVLDETARVVRAGPRVLIVETKSGFICANAGIDHSNVGGDQVTLLPNDPDRSARILAEGIESLSRVRPAVVICDSFGRPWRNGIVNVALGVHGIAALVDLRGTTDWLGQKLTATVLAVADEIAAAAGLVMPKSGGVPVALIRGVVDRGRVGRGRDLLRVAELDLFR